MKPYPDVTYYTSPGPIFHVDSEYEVRNQIWDLCQVLWAGLSLFVKFQALFCTYSTQYLKFSCKIFWSTP